jgi:hypothetical protein
MKPGIVLDPLGNNPLKMYAVSSENVQHLTVRSGTWIPPLHLTEEERRVVEVTGTTLVLGRAGTGKTVCLCNRMDLDRQSYSGDASFKQLFVARSDRLRRKVRNTVENSASVHFKTFDELLSHLETSLPATLKSETLFVPSQRVDFPKFKRDFYGSSKRWGGIDAMIVWTNSRSFIKGSLEAISYPDSVLPQSDYTSTVKLARKRCRLSHEQRCAVYKAFQAYKAYQSEAKLWDDCDRVSWLLRSLERTKNEFPETFEKLRYSKCYIDEVQDYTQAEILLFYYLSGPADLFFCGDSAQSVVEGVEFRFEEVRSVASFVAGPDRRHLVPQRPLIVNVNFRSHAGIMNVAAAVLSRMFVAFPDSAKQLKEDRGLFLGPRPGVLYKVKLPLFVEALATVLNGTRVVVHDDQKLRCEQLLNYKLVYGIRESKGLEYKNMILFDFFSDLPAQLQKPWRDLLLGREGPGYSFRYPEVEGQLKLLYTAITRGIDRLLFVESTPTVAGEAFCRWLTTTTARSTVRKGEPLAVRLRVIDVESLQMSVDEWVLSGLENAEAAEGCGGDDAEAADSFLQKAVHCFERARSDGLAAKARTHRRAVQFRAGIELAGAAGKDEAPDGNDGGGGTRAELEASAAQILGQLFREGLWVEASRVCRLVLPYLPPYTQDRLSAAVLPKLPTP